MPLFRRHLKLNETLQALSLRHSADVPKRDLFFHYGALRQICERVPFAFPDRFLPEFFRYAARPPHGLAQEGFALG